MDKLRAYINETVAPKIQGDGGWLELSSLKGESATMLLRGECSKCMIAESCMKWIETEVKRDLDMDITIRMDRKKPFFWDI